MFPPNAPHVEIKQGLLAILPDFRGFENENPYVHVKDFEEVVSLKVLIPINWLINPRIFM